MRLDNTNHEIIYKVALDGFKNNLVYVNERELISPAPLPIIPQFVADAIDTFKDEGDGLAVAIDYEVYTEALIKELSLDIKMRGWLWDSPNQELFARAWMDGYEVEKEPLYYVQLIDHATGYLNVHYDNQKLVGSNDEASEYKTQFTESEIKAMNKGEAYWLLKEPVEEVEGEA
ncbi:TPA: DUF1642 domain-containing protein [Listeria monocytogenes]